MSDPVKESRDLENEYIDIPMPPDMDKETFGALLKVLVRFMDREQ